MIDLKKKKTHFVLPLLFVLLLSFFSYTLESNNILDVPQPLNPDLITTPSGKLILTYEEFYGISKIVVLETDENANWNLTRNYDANQNADQNVVGGADLHYWNDSLMLTYISQDGGNYSLRILKKPTKESP